jgi:hypothetical protein
MSSHRGWVSYGPSGKPELPDDERNRIKEIVQERADARGELLAVVEVRVYEHDEMPYVTFPPDATLGVETDASAISDVVSRARDKLTAWR